MRFQWYQAHADQKGDGKVFPYISDKLFGTFVKIVSNFENSHWLQVYVSMRVIHLIY
jgi:hypothetical protein